jgi:LysM domain
MVGAVKHDPNNVLEQPADTTKYTVKNGDNLWDIAQKQVQDHEKRLTRQALNTATASYLAKLEGDNKWLAKRPGGYDLIYGRGTRLGPHHRPDRIYLPKWPSPRSSPPAHDASTKTIRRAIENAINAKTNKATTLKATLQKYANTTDYANTLSAIKTIVEGDLKQRASATKVKAIISPYLQSLQDSKISEQHRQAAIISLASRIAKEKRETTGEFEKSQSYKEYGFGA